MIKTSNIIGENLKKIRKLRELTLDELSTNSGVSKSMISEIERGLRNPSISTLWDIANSLKVPLNYFLKGNNLDSPIIYKINEKSTIKGENYSFHPLLNFDEDRRFEIYFNEYLPKSRTDSSIHYNGVEEYALITSGELTLYIDDKKYTAREGEVIHFIGNRHHFYANETDINVKAFVLMFYTK